MAFVSIVPGRHVLRGRDNVLSSPFDTFREAQPLCVGCPQVLQALTNSDKIQRLEKREDKLKQLTVELFGQ